MLCDKKVMIDIHPSVLQIKHLIKEHLTDESLKLDQYINVRGGTGKTGTL